MLIVKIMSGQDMPDDNPFKSFEIVQVPDGKRMRFTQNTVPEGQVGNFEGERFNLEVQNESGFWEKTALTGNAYVMNANGKTIANHGA